MAVRTRAPVLWLLLVSFFILLCLRSHPLGLKEIAFWIGRFILILALMTFIVSVVAPYFTIVHLSGSSQAVPQKENKHLQETVRKEQQELLSKKACEYNKNILKPRQEEKLKKVEERFYKMTGQTWKLSEGYTLGELEGEQNDSARPNDHVETANEEAIRKRKLPEHVRKPLPQCEQPQPKRVITLPEEPSTSEEDLSHRCPPGRATDLPELQPASILDTRKRRIAQQLTENNLNFKFTSHLYKEIMNFLDLTLSSMGDKMTIMPFRRQPVVTIALRCPSGRIYRRRFYKSSSSLLLLDWMMKIGYHPVLYSVCTPMPRCPLQLKENVTLENIGITRHTALTIEERDPL